MSATDRTSLSTPARSLMQLAVVERQLIMQGLDFVSLMRISRVCRQLLQESLHPQSGKFMPQGDLYSPGIVSAKQSAWISQAQRTCRLLQMHVPCTFSTGLASVPHSQRAAAMTSLLLEAERIRKLWTLTLYGGTDHDSSTGTFVEMPDELAMKIAFSPAVQSVRKVSWCSNHDECAWIRNTQVRRAILELPALTSIDLCSRALSALAADLPLASHVRHCVCMLRSHDFRELQPLSALRLDTLQLYRCGGGSQVPPHVCALNLPSLTSLTLSDGCCISHAQSRALFSQLPALRELTIRDSEEPGLLLLGAGDIGLAGLPALRRCLVAGNRAPKAAELRRFLHRCPQVTSFVFDPSEHENAEAVLQCLLEFGAWGPPVRVDIGEFKRRPPPSDADDEVLEQPPTRRSYEDDDDD